MERDIRKSSILNMDETTLLCLQERKNGRESKSYEWLCMTNEYEENQMALYYYKKDRGKENVNDILVDYCGVIQSDGYQVYSKFSSAEGHAGCLSHARRKFGDALKSNEALYRQITRKGTAEEKENLLDENPSFAKALWFVRQFDRIFKTEKKARQAKHSIQEIEEIRQTEEQPILEEMHEEAIQLIDQCAPSGKLYKALNYMLNQWESLIYYLKDGRIPATNNIAEREGIKPFVMARKNFLFADTIEGAEATSVWFSLIISARMNQLDAEKYLIYVLDQLSASETITDKLVERCLPYLEQLPASLRM